MTWRGDNNKTTCEHMQELDYFKEAENQEKFSKMLRERAVRNIYIPSVYRIGTGRRVLTTEWIDGAQLAKSPPEVVFLFHQEYLRLQTF